MTTKKPKPKPLDRVPLDGQLMRFTKHVSGSGPHPHYRPLRGNKRFTVRKVRWECRRTGPNLVARFAIFDKKTADWLHGKEPEHAPPSWRTHVRLCWRYGKTFRTRAAAWRYLRTTTVENEEYKLEMLNQALDRGAA